MTGYEDSPQLGGSPALTGRDEDTISPSITRVTVLKTVPRLGRWRRMIGLMMLGFVILMWTASSFLASNILADRSYNKPFMVTYLNTCAFVVPLIPILITKAWRHPDELREWREHWRTRLFRRRTRAPSRSSRQNSIPETGGLLSSKDNTSTVTPPHFPYLRSHAAHESLGLGATARISLEFCFLWFLANFFITACLEYTTVASSTILTSTSSIFTLGIGWQMGVERVTARKALGVLASFAGVALIASMDASGRGGGDDEHRGDFPEKTQGELILGDGLALASAVMYGLYSVLMKKRMGDATRVNMPLFFGFVGLFNIVLTWPGFFLLHYTGIEPFVIPPTQHIRAVLALNSLTSLFSDLAWAFAVLLTSPIVVAVGLSLTIPLSLVGQIILHNQTTTPMYWLGALVVVLSFLVINHEERRDAVSRESEHFSHRPTTTITAGGGGVDVVVHEDDLLSSHSSSSLPSLLISPRVPYLDEEEEAGARPGGR